jgi:DNA-binding NtrC family response regulator
VHRRCSHWADSPRRPLGARRNHATFGLALRLRLPVRAMNTMPTPTATVSPLLPRPLGYHGAVSDFKRRLIETTLQQMRGNRTHTARALGLQRTYLLRLIRELGVTAPPPPPRRRNPAV